VNYLLLARGSSLETARVLAVSADQRLVDRFLRQLAEEPEHDEPEHPGPLHLTLIPGGEAADH
jgi:hypothetical protein